MVFVLATRDPADAKFDPLGTQTIDAGVQPVIERWLATEPVEKAFGVLRASWDELLSVLHVETPDADTNRMVNI